MRVGLRAVSVPSATSRPAERRHGIALQCGLVLLGRAELLDRLVLGEMQRHAGRGDDVAVRREAVHLRLDERRAVTRTGPRNRRADRLVHLDRVAAVDRDARHAVRLRLHREVLAVRAVRVLLLGARVDVVAVVLHHEDDRAASRATRCSASRTNAPCLEAPSPKKHRTTWPCLRICAAHAAPAACGIPAADDPRRAEKAVRRRRSDASSRRCPCTGRPCARRSRPSSPWGRSRARADSRGSDRSRRTGRRARASRSSRRSTPRRRRRDACGRGSRPDARRTSA